MSLKSIFMGMALLVGGAASAATLSLQSGETVTINPNQTTTVSCEGGSGGPVGQCASLLNSLERRFVTTLENYNGGYEKTSAVMPAIWGEFKESTPSSCLFEAREVCNNVCLKYYNGGYERTSACQNLCK